MSTPMRHARADLDRSLTARTVRSRVPRSVVQRVEAEAYEGLIASARLQAGSYLTHTAMHHVALLSGEEARLIQQCPPAEPRLKVLVDHFAGLCAYELATFGR